MSNTYKIPTRSSIIKALWLTCAAVDAVCMADEPLNVVDHLFWTKQFIMLIMMVMMVIAMLMGWMVMVMMNAGGDS